MKFALPVGSTSVILTVFVLDSTVTTGAGKAGLDHTSGISGGYVRMGGTGVALAVDEDVSTEGTYQAPSAAGKVRIGTPANLPAGTYELHFHNDLFASGARSLTIVLTGTGIAPITIEVQLTAVDLNDATSAGLSRLDAAITTREADGAAAAAVATLENLSAAEAETAAAAALAAYDPPTRSEATDDKDEILADLDTVAAGVAAILDDTGTSGVVVAAGSKTGYALTAAYDAAKTAAPTGEAAAALASYDPPTRAEATSDKDAVIAAIPSASANAAAILAAAVEVGVSVKAMLRLIGAVVIGKVSGAGTTTNTFRGINDDIDRVTSTVDGSGNRTAVTLDAGDPE